MLNQIDTYFAKTVAKIDSFFDNQGQRFNQLLDTSFNIATEKIGNLFATMELLPNHWEQLDPISRIQYKLAKLSLVLNVAKATRILINHPTVETVGDQFIEKILTTLKPKDDPQFDKWLYAQAALLHRQEAYNHGLLENPFYQSEFFRLLRKSGVIDHELLKLRGQFSNTMISHETLRGLVQTYLDNDSLH